MYITAQYVYNRYKNYEMLADEVVSIVRKIRDNDIKRCNVILDVVKGEVFKCRGFHIYGKEIDGYEKDSYQRLLDYFHAMHPQQIDNLLKAIQTIQE